MTNKYIVEIETEAGHAAFCAVHILSVACGNGLLDVQMDAGARVSFSFRNAERAGAAYQKIVEAIRAVA